MKSTILISIIILLTIGCTTKKDNIEEPLKRALQKTINKYPNYNIEKIIVNDKKLDIFISDSLDVNNSPYSNEFLTHYLQKIRTQIMKFDSISIDIRMVHRESKYPNDRIYFNVKQLLQVFNERDKIPSYVAALEWIFENDNRVTMEVANVAYASSKGIKDIWSLEDNIFIFMQTYYQDCKQPLIIYLANKIEAKLNPETNIYQKKAKEICNKIFSNCKWKNPI